MMKTLRIGIGLFALLLAGILLLPSLIDLAVYKKQYLPLVEEAIRREVDVGAVRLRLLPLPSIRLSRLKVSDHPAFSQDPFLTARELKLRLKLGPLLKGRFLVDEFVLEQPVIHLLKQPDGTFNFSDIGKKKHKQERRDVLKRKESAPPVQEPVRLSELLPSRVRIEQGQITFQTKGQKPFTIHGIDLSLQDFTTERPFPYRAALKFPGFKTISLEGQMSYRETGATLHLKENHLKAQDVDFSVTGTVADLTGIPQVDLSVVNDGFEIQPIFQLLSSIGIAPKELDMSGPLGLSISMRGPSHSLASQARAQFKGIKIHDTRAFKGTLGGEILLTLPLGEDAPLAHAIRGQGKLTARDGELTNVNMISKVKQITGFLGLPREESREATTFKTLETEFTLNQGIAVFQRVHLVSRLMEAEGTGKMTLSSPKLDLAVEAALSPQLSARAGSRKTATFLKDSQGRIVVPLRIRGPIEKPSVNVNREKLFKEKSGQLLEKEKRSFLERLFRRR